MIYLYICLGVIGGLFLLLFIFLYIVYRGVFYTPQKGQNNDFFLTEQTYKSCDKEMVMEMIRSVRAITYEDAFITSFDNKKLHARIYKNPKSDTVCIMCHGYRGTPCRDFSGGAKEMIEKGYNVILIDERGHGLSEGHTITFGKKEQEDCLSWVKYAKETFGNNKKLVLVGISLGGAVVLLVSDRVEEGTKIIADSPFTMAKEIICETMKTHLHLPPKLFWPLTHLSIIIFGHTKLSDVDAKKNVEKSKAQILIIHGEEDTVVPCNISKALHDKYPDKVQYELFPKAEHGLSYIVDKERYQRVITEFLEK